MNILPPGVNIDSLVNDLRLISWEAANILLFYSKKISKRSSKKNIINLKNNNEPVTIADLEVNNLIIKNLKNKYPKIKWNILSEENTNDFIQSSSNFDWKWVLDPLEGTNMCASGRGNALSVIAMARNGRFLHAPDTYMFKIAVGPAGKDVIDIDATPTQNLEAVADAKGIYVEDLTVVVLDRPRHIDLIREIREAGARIRLIQDGDISAAIATCKDEAGVDLLMGIGGAPEGVIAAAALRCVGGDMVAKLVPQDAQSAERCRDMGINDLSRKYGIQDLAGGDVLFAATGVTNGSFLRGVRFLRGGAITHSVVMRSKSRTIRSIRAEHRFDQNPEYD